MPAVEEANSISEELDKRVKFEIILVAPNKLGDLKGKGFIKSGSKKIRHIQKLTIYEKSIPILCPILMKFGEINHIMRLSFSPSFMRIGQKMWILY